MHTEDINLASRGVDAQELIADSTCSIQITVVTRSYRTGKSSSPTKLA